MTKESTDNKIFSLSADQTSNFCYQLSLMLKAGISSEESISILLDDAQTSQEQILLMRIQEALFDSKQLSDALSATEAFPSYLINMVEIGQASGRLDQVFEALSEYYHRDAATQNAIRKTVTYPTIMATMIALVFLTLMTYVLPVFQQVFNQLGMSLSPMIQYLINFGSASKYIAGGLSIILLVGTIILCFLFRTNKGAKTMALLNKKFLSRSSISQSINRSQFSSSMALMLSSGLPLDEAMERTYNLLEHSTMAIRIKNCQAQMDEGVSFPKAVEKTGILTGLQTGLLKSGFRAGASVQVMKEISNRCQEESDTKLDQLLGRFEYGLVIILCLSVGFVLLSVMLPLLGIMAGISA